jgi:hypothetical protein
MIANDEFLVELVKRLGQANLPGQAAGWMKPGRAAKLLKVSPSTLKAYRQSGYLKPGTHFRILHSTKFKRGQPLPKYTHYEYNVEACAKLWA